MLTEAIPIYLTATTHKPIQPAPKLDKIMEQVRYDLKDLNFIYTDDVGGDISDQRISQEAISGIHRKFLADNDFEEVMDENVNDGIIYGSGIQMTYKEKGILKTKNVDLLNLYWNPSNFAGGMKIKPFSKTLRQIINDKKMDKASVKKLIQDTCKTDVVTKLTLEELEQPINLYKVFTPTEKDGKMHVDIIDQDRDLHYFEHKDFPVSFQKWDRKKRKGFQDALGVGAFEEIFNIFIQNKEYAKMVDKNLRISANTLYQKKIDHKTDNMVGRNVLDAEPGTINGYIDTPITPMSMGGSEPLAQLHNFRSSLDLELSNAMNVGEVLSGAKAPSGMSYALGNLLSENSSSVIKETKKGYASFLRKFYRQEVIPYMISAFDAKVDIRKYLSSGQLRSIIEFVSARKVQLKQIDALVNDKPFNLSLVTQRVERETENEKLNTTKILTRLKENIQSIEPFISGEQVSNLQRQTFLEKLEREYTSQHQRN